MLERVSGSILLESHHSKPQLCELGYQLLSSPHLTPSITTSPHLLLLGGGAENTQKGERASDRTLNVHRRKMCRNRCINYPSHEESKPLRQTCDYAIFYTATTVHGCINQIVTNKPTQQTQASYRIVVVWH